MTDSIIQKKSYQFSLKIIDIYKSLNYKQREFVLARQILRCGTSIGANIEEALGGQSKKDFVSKISIAYKEARETGYWIRLLRDSRILSKEESQVLLSDCNELLRIISSIIISSKANS